MARGEDILRIAREHIGEDYLLGVVVRKDDATWAGPWDCAEFVSWCVYQACGILYGCSSRNNPRTADAWTGFWLRDSEVLGRCISVAEAAVTPGAALLRVGAKTGHIVLCIGEHNGTIEAYSAERGVIQHTLLGRRWTTGVLVPGVSYTLVGTAPVVAVPKVYRYSYPKMMRGAVVQSIQLALVQAGYSVAVDGVYGPRTHATVLRFQGDNGLLQDGEVGAMTAERLGVSLA